MYLFNELFCEHYIDKRCDTHACEFRNLPVMDGAIYSDAEKNIKAGIYFTANGENIIWHDMRYDEVDPKTAVVTVESDDGKATLILRESGIEISTDIDGLTLIPVYDRDRVFGTVGDKDKFANANNSKTSMSFIEKTQVKNNDIIFRMNEFDYGIRVAEGRLNEDLSVKAENRKIKLKAKI